MNKRIRINAAWFSEFRWPQFNELFPCRLRMAQQPNEGGDKLANPFGSPPSNSHGFIAFSSSTPVGGSHAGANAQGSHFKPRRGKGNRRGNWERFGAAQDQSPQMNGKSNEWPEEAHGKRSVNLTLARGAY